MDDFSKNDDVLIEESTQKTDEKQIDAIINEMESHIGGEGNDTVSSQFSSENTNFQTNHWDSFLDSLDESSLDYFAKTAYYLAFRVVSTKFTPDEKKEVETLFSPSGDILNKSRPLVKQLLSKYLFKFFPDVQVGEVGPEIKLGIVLGLPLSSAVREAHGHIRERRHLEMVKASRQ